MAHVGVIATYPLFHGFYPDGTPLLGGRLVYLSGRDLGPYGCVP